MPTTIDFQKHQFFELVSVSEIRAAQYQLTSELEPQIKELVKQTEIGLLKLHKREQMLRLNVGLSLSLSFGPCAFLTTILQRFLNEGTCNGTMTLLPETRKKKKRMTNKQKEREQALKLISSLTAN